MNAEDFEHACASSGSGCTAIARMTGSVVDGEDVLQDALIKALQARAQGAVVDNPEAWLRRIAHNISLDFLRRRRATRALRSSTIWRTHRCRKRTSSRSAFGRSCNCPNSSAVR